MLLMKTHRTQRGKKYEKQHTRVYPRKVSWDTKVEEEKERKGRDKMKVVQKQTPMVWRHAGINS